MQEYSGVSTSLGTLSELAYREYTLMSLKNDERL